MSENRRFCHYYITMRFLNTRGAVEMFNTIDALPYNAMWELSRDEQDNTYTVGLSSDFIFCNADGDWIKADAYMTCLRRLMQSLGMDVTNNHAFRMSLNSNVLIPKGIDVTDRARLLGHSIKTNLRFYSFAKKNANYEILNLLSN